MAMPLFGVLESSPVMLNQHVERDFAAEEHADEPTVCVYTNDT